MENFILENLQELQMLGYLSQNNTIDLKIAQVWSKALTDLALIDLQTVFQYITKNGLPTDEKGNKTYTLTPAVIRQIYNDLRLKYKPFQALEREIQPLGKEKEALKKNENAFLYILMNEPDNDRAYYCLLGLYKILGDTQAAEEVKALYKAHSTRKPAMSGAWHDSTAQFIESKKVYWGDSPAISFLTVNQPAGRELAHV